MHMHLLRTFVITAACAIVTVPAIAQTGATPPPPRGERPARAFQIDPETDDVLLTIQSAVDPTPQQMEAIMALYKGYRHSQLDAFNELRRNFGRGGRDRDGERPDHDQMREARTRIRQKMEAMNESFLAACRDVLDESRLEAWDECAARIELNPRFGGRRGDGRDGSRRGPDAGEMAPDFELTDLEGNTVSLSAMRGRPVVIEFGSLTCPIFRRKVEDFKALRQHYGDQVQWLLVYTREAHPSDGWVSRANVREKIEIPQHTSFEDRVKLATKCSEMTDHELPVVVDTFDDKVTTMYGGFPNRGFVIDGEGRVVSAQTWIQVGPTRAALNELLGRTGEPELIIDPEPPSRSGNRG